MSDIPPFSGDAPLCLKCGYESAHTVYRTVDDLKDVKDEHLERECKRCAYKWPEAVVTPLRGCYHWTCDKPQAKRRVVLINGNDGSVSYRCTVFCEEHTELLLKNVKAALGTKYSTGFDVYRIEPI